MLLVAIDTKVIQYVIVIYSFISNLVSLVNQNTKTQLAVYHGNAALMCMVVICSKPWYKYVQTALL